jgi:hypothetical protein
MITRYTESRWVSGPAYYERQNAEKYFGPRTVTLKEYAPKLSKPDMFQPNITLEDQLNVCLPSEEYGHCLFTLLKGIKSNICLTVSLI